MKYPQDYSTLYQLTLFTLAERPTSHCTFCTQTHICIYANRPPLSPSPLHAFTSHLQVMPHGKFFFSFSFFFEVFISATDRKKGIYNQSMGILIPVPLSQCVDWAEYAHTQKKEQNNERIHSRSVDHKRLSRQNNEQQNPTHFILRDINKEESAIFKKGTNNQTNNLWHEYEESGVCRATGEMN